jgi:hypothetical protein
VRSEDQQSEVTFTCDSFVDKAEILLPAACAAALG